MRRVRLLQTEHHIRQKFHLVLLDKVHRYVFFFVRRLLALYHFCEFVFDTEVGGVDAAAVRARPDELPWEPLRAAAQKRERVHAALAQNLRKLDRVAEVVDLPRVPCPALHHVFLIEAAIVEVADEHLAVNAALVRLVVRAADEFELFLLHQVLECFALLGIIVPVRFHVRNLLDDECVCRIGTAGVDVLADQVERGECIAPLAVLVDPHRIVVEVRVKVDAFPVRRRAHDHRVPRVCVRACGQLDVELRLAGSAFRKRGNRGAHVSEIVRCDRLQRFRSAFQHQIAAHIDLNVFQRRRAGVFKFKGNYFHRLLFGSVEKPGRERPRKFHRCARPDSRRNHQHRYQSDNPHSLLHPPHLQ